jgi:hypothetical protein
MNKIKEDMKVKEAMKDAEQRRRGILLNHASQFPSLLLTGG